MKFAGIVRTAALIVFAAQPAAAQTTDKAEITVTNNRRDDITMRFDYAFRNYHWNLMSHPVEGGGEILYRFPSNIPGCEKLREWHITDGVLSIVDAKGLFCEKRISLCDKRATTMNVQADKCLWTEQ